MRLQWGILATKPKKKQTSYITYMWMTG